MKRFVGFFFTLLLLPTLVAAQPEAKKQPAKKEPAKFTVPFELIKTQHMVVSIKVNGKGPYKLVFDTGAPDSLVSAKIMKEAGLVTRDAPLIRIFNNHGTGTIKDLEMGELKAQNLSCQVMDHPTVEAIGKFAGRLDGILGFTFYARYKMSIDYEKNLITFEEGTYVPGDVMKQMMARFSAPKSERDAPKILAPAGLLGIRVEKAKDDEDAGVTVKDVLPGSAAAAAGFKAGDRLLTLDGRWTDSVNDLYIAAGFMKAGTPAMAQVLRGGKKVQLKLTVRAGL